MGKSSHGKKSDKYKEEKYCYSSESRKRLISDSSSGPVEDIKSHHSGSRVPQRRRHHSRSPIEKKTEAQSIEYYERKRISKEERVAGQTDRKRQSSCVDKYQEESQKNSCHSRDKVDELGFSFKRYCYELKVFLRDEDLVPDSEDFWKFLKNYETVQNRAGRKKHNLEFAGKKEL
jgi:hypothetical protein